MFVKIVILVIPVLCGAKATVSGAKVRVGVAKATADAVVSETVVSEAVVSVAKATVRMSDHLLKNALEKPLEIS